MHNRRNTRALTTTSKEVAIMQKSGQFTGKPGKPLDFSPK
jgi:hypothetical protein